MVDFACLETLFQTDFVKFKLRNELVLNNPKMFVFSCCFVRYTI